MGILCPVIPPATYVVPLRNTKFAQRSAVGSELVGHDGCYSHGPGGSLALSVTVIAWRKLRTDDN
jgi:hypothetical protein